MPNWTVSEKKAFALQQRMRKLQVSESDLEEHFVRSQGAGGQNVNKVSTCVVLLHRPTGLTVRCQRERSQSLNRFLARRLLLDRIEAERYGRVSAERARIEKIRRQKRKRSKRAKEKMLDRKTVHGLKKAWRAAPRHDD